MITTRGKNNGRRCTKCKTKDKVDGGLGLCKSCYDLRDYHLFPEKHNKATRKWMAKNKERVREIARDTYWKNRASRLQRNKIYN